MCAGPRSESWRTSARHGRRRKRPERRRKRPEQRPKRRSLRSGLRSSPFARSSRRSALAANSAGRLEASHPPSFGARPDRSLDRVQAGASVGRCSTIFPGLSLDILPISGITPVTQEVTLPGFLHAFAGRHGSGARQRAARLGPRRGRPERPTFHDPVAGGVHLAVHALGAPARPSAQTTCHARGGVTRRAETGRIGKMNPASPPPRT